jgi:uncharacterized protein
LGAPRIFVDADACPVKPEVYKVAGRHRLRVTVVGNSRMRAPEEPWVELVVVGRHLDAADDWIAERAGEDDIVVTADIPLAARCLAKGAQVIGTTGHPFDEESIGDALATRELMAGLREAGEITGGPRPFTPRDRSRFLQRLEEMIQKALRRQRAPLL